MAWRDGVKCNDDMYKTNSLQMVTVLFQRLSISVLTRYGKQRDGIRLGI